MKMQIKIIILVTIIIVFGFVLLNLTNRDKENISSAINQVVTSWAERAERSARLTNDKSRAVIARSIVKTLHPTADNPNMDSFDVKF